jgi:hypothetical protein
VEVWKYGERNSPATGANSLVPPNDLRSWLMMAFGTRFDITCSMVFL